MPMYVAQLDNLDDPEFRFLELLQEIGPLEASPPCLLTEDYAERCELNAEWEAEFAEALAGDSDD